MAKDHEFRSYDYIRSCLKELGWDTRNPGRGGAVYMQSEFRRHDPLLKEALGGHVPENIALIPAPGGFRYWIFEAKAAVSDLQEAIGEGERYAGWINQVEEGKAPFVSGVAGTPDQSIYIETRYWNGDEWSTVSINSYDTTGFLTLDQCRRILARNNARDDYFDDDPDRFLRKSTAINKTLQANEVPVGERAKTLAALLLALAYDGNLPVWDTATRMVREVNGCIQDFLNEHRKGSFAPAVTLVQPISESNHVKYRRAVVETLQHLREMNIRSAINSGDDSLGKFYETFLKYANGAKDMGIVLTPRHITKFAVDVLGVGPEDTVFDPACGTGGFLVSAMDAMRTTLAPAQYTAFKNDGLFGVEQRDDVYGLALVNMIFRGDGKSHIENGNCFDYAFWHRDGRVFQAPRDEAALDGATAPFSKVLMNPPFKLKETAEWEFVDYGLTQTKPGGYLFAILPHVVVEGSTNETWREELLKRHTLKAVVKLDKNLFYPITESTYAVVIEAHRPHDANSDVFFGVLFDDKHRLRRSKLLSSYVEADNVGQMTDLLKRHLLGRPLSPAESYKPRELILSKAGADTFAPEAFFDAGNPVSKPDLTSRRVGLAAAKQQVLARAQPQSAHSADLAAVRVLDLIEEVIEAPLRTLKGARPGDVPVGPRPPATTGLAAGGMLAPNTAYGTASPFRESTTPSRARRFGTPTSFPPLWGRSTFSDLPRNGWSMRMPSCTCARR